MAMAKRINTKITKMLGIDYPILCGGMQWLTRAEFVAEVCNAGGFGFITAETFETPEDLRQEIRKMPDLTDKPFGVNISMVPEIGNIRERTLALLDVVCEEGVTAVETSGRSPDLLMPKLKEAGIKVIHKLTSVRHALSAQKVGVDAVALLGYGSGGHIGLQNVASFVLIPLAAANLEIPVIAAGAISNGRGLLGALAMGAEAVLLGTAFFVTKECPVPPAIKEKFIQTREDETTLMMSSIRNPMRCLKNKLAEEVQAMEAKGATLEQILAMIPGRNLKKAFEEGDLEISALPSGQGVGLINEIKSVRELMEGIMSEADKLLERLNKMAS